MTRMLIRHEKQDPFELKYKNYDKNHRLFQEVKGNDTPLFIEWKETVFQEIRWNRYYGNLKKSPGMYFARQTKTGDKY